MILFWIYCRPRFCRRGWSNIDWFSIETVCWKGALLRKFLSNTWRLRRKDLKTLSNWHHRITIHMTKILNTFKSIFSTCQLLNRLQTTQIYGFNSRTLRNDPKLSINRSTRLKWVCDKVQKSLYVFFDARVLRNGFIKSCAVKRNYKVMFNRHII